MSAERALLLDVKAAAEGIPSARVVEQKKERAIAIELPPSARILFFVSARYPDVPPVAQIVADDFSTFVAVRWSDPVSARVKLRAFLDAHVSGPAPYRVLWGYNAAAPLTAEAELARIARMSPLVTGASEAPLLMSCVAQRVDAVTAEALRTATVMIIGLGSAGSYLAEQFARMGVGKVIGIDNEDVEMHNLTRTAYELVDVGTRKTSALTRRLAAINPETKLQMFDTDVKKLPGETLRAAFAEASLVIAATDDIGAQNLVNSCAFYAQKVALFVGLYRRADGGEIVWVLPGATPCYACCTGSLRDRAEEGGVAPERSEDDYGRLRGEIALSADIHHVMSAALKMAVSILCLAKPEELSASRLVLSAVERGLHMMTLGMTPDYWFYPEVFEPIVGTQHAFQSVWMRCTSWSDCQVCGEHSSAMDTFVNRVVSMTDELREQALRQMRS